MNATQLVQCECEACACHNFVGMPDGFWPDVVTCDPMAGVCAACGTAWADFGIIRIEEVIAGLAGNGLQASWEMTGGNTGTLFVHLGHGIDVVAGPGVHSDAMAYTDEWSVGVCSVDDDGAIEDVSIDYFPTTAADTVRVMTTLAGENGWVA